jgi:ParB/RepB/Spo0J family partition protein
MAPRKPKSDTVSEAADISGPAALAVEDANAVRPIVAPWFAEVPHAAIAPDPDNARRDFDADALSELAATIYSHGLLQPLVVMPPAPDGVHQLVAGERRWRAIGLLIARGEWDAGRRIAVRIETAEDQARMEAALIENLQRIDLNHMEAGLAFETLGSRFHLSNKVIAEKIGRSAEYVQQHRRLAGLEPELQTKVRTGDMPMHEALRILAKPKPKDLGPTVMMVLAEIYHRCVHRPDKVYNYYGGSTECAFDANGGELQQLRDRRIVNFEAHSWRDHRAHLSMGYEAQQFLELLAPVAAKNEAEALEALNGYRVAGGVGPLQEGYYTHWLNGPFPLSPDAEKAIEEDKRRAQAEKARAETEKAERAAAVEGIAALEKELAAEEGWAQPPSLLAEISHAGSTRIRFPLTYANGSIRDAAEKAVLSLHWGFGDDQPRFGRAIALALNLAAGFGGAEGLLSEAPAGGDDAEAGEEAGASDELEAV